MTGKIWIFNLVACHAHNNGGFVAMTDMELKGGGYREVSSDLVRLDLVDPRSIGPGWTLAVGGGYSSAES